MRIMLSAIKRRMVIGRRNIDSQVIQLNQKEAVMRQNFTILLLIVSMIFMVVSCGSQTTDSTTTSAGTFDSPGGYHANFAVTRKNLPAYARHSCIDNTNCNGTTGC